MANAEMLEPRAKEEIVGKVHEYVPALFLEYRVLGNGFVEAEHVARILGKDPRVVKAYRQKPKERSRGDLPVKYADVEGRGCVPLNMFSGISHLIWGDLFMEIYLDRDGAGSLERIPVAIETSHLGDGGVLLQTRQYGKGLGRGVGVDFERGDVYVPNTDPNIEFYRSRSLEIKEPGEPFIGGW